MPWREQNEREQTWQAEQYDPLEKQMKRIATQGEDLRRQQGQTVGLANVVAGQRSTIPKNLCSEPAEGVFSEALDF